MGEPKNHEIKCRFKVSKSEHTRIMEMVKSCGMNLQQYVKYLLLHTKLTIKQEF